MSTEPDDANRSRLAGSANVRTRGYREQLDKLPPQIRGLADAAFQLFSREPRHPSLRLHELSNTRAGRHRAGSRSVSITRGYRAIYKVDGDTNVWYWIGSHNDYENFTGRK